MIFHMPPLPACLHVKVLKATTDYFHFYAKANISFRLEAFFVNTLHNWVKIFVKILKLLVKGQLISECLQIYQN